MARPGLTWRSTYQCRKAKTLGAEACPLPIFDRAKIEAPALELFETEALSYADTGDHVAAQLDTRIADATTHAARASREAAELRTQADRITRDYRAAKPGRGPLVRAAREHRRGADRG